MLNHLVLVGRLTSDLEIKEVENKNEYYITLAVSRSYKNAEGEYETDFIKCLLSPGISQQVSEWCKKATL